MKLKIKELLKNIKHITEVNEIKKGYSFDLKYKIKINDTYKLLKVYDKKIKTQVLDKLDKMKILYQNGIKCPNVYQYGEYKDYCFSIVDYIEGHDADEVLPHLDLSKQYQIGFVAGGDLRKINQIDIKQPIIDEHKTKDQFNQCIKKYHQLNLDDKLPHEEEIIEYVYNNMHLAHKRLKVFAHYDFHARNIIIKDDQYAGIIDFNRCRITDPYNEFNKLELFSTVISQPFSKGVVDGYFNHQIPDDFWPYRAFTMAKNIFYHILWTYELFPQEKENAYQTIKHVLYQYDNFRRTVPRWYEE